MRLLPLILLSGCFCPLWPQDEPADGETVIEQQASKEILAEMAEQLEPTVLSVGVLEGAPSIMPIQADEAGPLPGDPGSGLQILQVAPLTSGRTPLQASVVFDRPMVALSDLDSMNAQVPLSCSPVAGKLRWAGTSTAVFLPEGQRFPKATAFTCSVDAGASALDGTALENKVQWTFETERPAVERMSPWDGFSQHEPGEPVVLTFNQPVDPAVVAPFIEVSTEAGEKLQITVDRPEEGKHLERMVAVHAPMTTDTHYSVRVLAGVRGTEGPLGARETWAAGFDTYPPLRLENWSPTGTTDPYTSLELQFSTSVDLTQLAELVSLSPDPGDSWDPAQGYESTHWYYYTRLDPRTEYTLTLKPGVKDIHGQVLLEGKSFSFTTGDLDPVVDAPSGFQIYAANNPLDLPIRHLNVAQVKARLARVEPGQLVREADWDDAVEVALRGASSVDLPTEDVPNHWEIDTLDLRPYLDAEGTGMVAVDVWSPQVLDWRKNPRHHQLLLQVTDLGTTVKVSPDKAEAWVTRLSDGQPVQGAQVQFWRDGEVVGTASTDATGMASTAMHLPSNWSSWSDPVWAEVSQGTDRAVASQQWDSSIGPWRFGIWSNFEPDGRSPTSHAFSDRGIYRPGDPAHARVTFRMKSAQGLELPPNAEVSWKLSSPRGNDVAGGDGRLDDRGGISIDTTLPADGELGDYSLAVYASGEDWSSSSYSSLAVREYRAPAFRVDVTGPADHTAGKALAADVSARYLFGAPMKDARVRWSVWREEAWFRPEGWDGWSFGPEHRWWEWQEEDYGDLGVLSQGTDTTDAQGAFRISQEIPAGELSRAFDYTLEATVTDTDRQVIANRATARVHPAAFYVGLRAGARLPVAGEPTHVEVVAVDHQGKPRKGASVDLKIVRRTWDRVREKGMDGRWQWVDTAVDEEVLAQKISARAEPVEVQLTPEKPGYYVITGTASDDAGNSVTAEESMYVVGGGYTPWAFSEENMLELVPDKQRYAPGETAKVLVKSPVEGMQALVTVEREGVLQREVLTLEGTATAIELPILEDWRPNVYVSVLGVTGAGPQDSPDKGRPQVYVGMVELSVDAEAEHLAVDVTPGREVYRPGDTVAVEVSVQREGQPVSGAGVTLYAVDEAVLSLTAYETPDAHATFYQDHGLSVLTGDSRIRVLDRAAYLTKGAATGGGGGMDGEELAVRKKFLTTIAWLPDLRTGPDGKISASFDLPDNLTTFRIMAVADAGAESFGAGDEEIRVTRPLIARPALPRFLRMGDVAFAGAVVHNNADQERMVKVDASVEGAFLDGAPVTVRVPAHGAVEVPFRLHAETEGQARFTFQVESGSDKDAVQISLPVRRTIPQEVTATAGTTVASVTERIALPGSIKAGSGGLEIDLASTALVGAGTGLDYLTTYPHGCIEQRSSRALASLVALSVYDKAGVTVPEADLRRNVEGVLAELSDFRHHSGGMGYWPGSRDASVMGTAYAVELMGRARAAGFSVDEDLLDDNAAYLRDVLGGKRMPSWWDRHLSLNARTYAAVALSRARRGDAGQNQRLYNEKSDLTIWGQANLLEAIARTTGPDARTVALERDLQSRLYIEAATAQVREADNCRCSALWHSDDLATASVLEALTVARGSHPMGPKLAAHLVQARRHGRWHNTRATAAALAALSTYADRYEKGTDPVMATVALAGKQLFSEPIPSPGTARIELPIDEVSSGDLVFSTADDARLYYEARLRYAPVELPPRDEGFTLVRTYEVLEGEGETGAVTAGSLLRVTLRVVTPVERHAVAVVDALPAGLEPVDASLATSSQAPGSGGAEDTGRRPQDTGDLPDFGGWWSTWVFDHTELRDDRVSLYSSYMPAGIHTYQYVVRATTPGIYDQPAATVEEMYEPEHFGRTEGRQFVVGTAKVAKK